MPYITSSMMEAVNTCVKWGVIHNVLNRRFVTGYRQMALEAGSLMHEVFSVLNLYQLGVIQGLSDHMNHHGAVILGEDRWNFIINCVENLKGDQQLVCETLALQTIATSDFYDDPNDRNRTTANLEHVAIELVAYWLMRFQNFNIYVEDTADPTKPVGLEMSLDVVFTIKAYGTNYNVRFIGLADALYQNHDTRVVTLGEYKTSSSMNDAWERAFETRHQITGYNAALKAYFPNVAGNTILLGSAVPVPRTKTRVQHFSVPRDDDHTKQFLNTILFTMGLIESYRDTPLTAPMFTHSCNRYFRPCAFLDLCSASLEDQFVMLEQMEIAPALSPSEMKALLRKD